LPSTYGIGDLGPAAVNYIEWLAEAGVRWWQVLPLHPPGPGDSPYSAISTFAGNELLVSPERLVEDQLLDEGDLADVPDFPKEWVDFGAVASYKNKLLAGAFDRFRERNRADLLEELAAFRDSHREWLADFALFRALKDDRGGQPWYDWPRPLARREPEAMLNWMEDHRSEVAFVEFCQWLFFRQWSALRDTANQLGIGIFGDVPIFVALDSAEVWAHPDLFLLDDDRQTTVVAGVPPDYFSETGQLWGNPLYDWDRMANDGYSWWIARMRHALLLSDVVRLDHFRGFASYWEVPAEEDTAINGRWCEGPGRALFDAMSEALGGLPLVAEDLGEITPDVVALRKELEVPGMAILHFAFSTEPRSSFIPYALERDLVIYTGTHDNNTTVGWYLEDATEAERDLVRRYTASSGREVHWDLSRLAMASVANTPDEHPGGRGGQLELSHHSFDAR
jgi:4-alpha-glucanotransferase